MDDESDAGVETNLEEGSDLEKTGVEADESLSSEDSEDEIDWKAEYEKANTEREHYKDALDQKRQLRKKPPTPEVSNEEQDDETEDDDNKPLTRADLRQERALEKVDSILAATVTDPDKRKLVRLYYDTRIRQTGTSDDAIRADVDAALAIAEAPKLRKTTEELARIANRDNTPPMQGSSTDRGADRQSHKFSAEQVKELTETATRIGAEPAKFIEQAWKNQQQGR